MANLRRAFLEQKLYRAGKLPLRTAAEVVVDARANPTTGLRRNRKTQTFAP